MNLEIYDSKIRYQNASLLSGTFDELMEIDDKRFPKDIKLIKEFLKDDDLIELSITSSCIGFTKTFTKRYRRP